MFDEILGVPAHPLLVHAAVVFIPLLIIAALAYALVPFVRRWTWWAVVGLAVVAPFAAWFATLSGNNLRNRLASQGMDLVKIDEHRDFGDKTLWATIVLAVLAVGLVALTMRRRPETPTVTSTSADPEVAADAASAMAANRSTSATGGTAGAKILTIVLTVVLVISAGVSGYYVFKTGDTGAHLVWG